MSNRQITCQWGDHDVPAVGTTPRGTTVCAECAPLSGFPITGLTGQPVAEDVEFYDTLLDSVPDETEDRSVAL
jgi:hypothetical protein